VRQEASVVVTDLDNTLFDWVRIWHEPFRAMLDKIVDISGIPEERLIPEIRRVHQRHRTTEYTFLLQELPSLRERHGAGVSLTTVYDEALHACRKKRIEVTATYPEVIPTLQTLRGKGVLLVAYTESMAFHTQWRMVQLGLDRLIDFLYSRPDHDFPDGVTREQLRQHAPQDYELAVTKHRYTPPGEIKPNPDLLRDILDDVSARRQESIYVGDSAMKDVAMAQQAGVTDVWAKYGVAQHRKEYELLRAVTHWTDEDVEREKNLSQPEHPAPYVLEESFAELLDLFDFAAFEETAHVSGRQED